MSIGAVTCVNWGCGAVFVVEVREHEAFSCPECGTWYRPDANPHPLAQTARVEPLDAA